MLFSAIARTAEVDWRADHGQELLPAQIFL